MAHTLSTAGISHHPISQVKAPLKSLNPPEHPLAKDGFFQSPNLPPKSEIPFVKQAEEDRIPYLLPQEAEVPADPRPPLRTGKDRTAHEHVPAKAAPPARQDPLKAISWHRSTKNLGNYLLKGVKESFDEAHKEVTRAQETLTACQKESFTEKSTRAARSIWNFLTTDLRKDIKNYFLIRRSLKDAQANLKEAQSHQDQALQSLIPVFNEAKDPAVKSAIFCDLLRKVPSSVLKQLLLRNPHLDMDVQTGALQETLLSQAYSYHGSQSLKFNQARDAKADPVVVKQLKSQLDNALRTLVLVFRHSNDIALKNKIFQSLLPSTTAHELEPFWLDAHVDINGQNNARETPLLIALKAPSVLGNVSKLLAIPGIDVNKQLKFAYTSDFDIKNFQILLGDKRFDKKGVDNFFWLVKSADVHALVSHWNSITKKYAPAEKEALLVMAFHIALRDGRGLLDEANEAKRNVLHALVQDCKLNVAALSDSAIQTAVHIIAHADDSERALPYLFSLPGLKERLLDHMARRQQPAKIDMRLAASIRKGDTPDMFTFYLQFNPTLEALKGCLPALRYKTNNATEEKDKLKYIDVLVKFMVDNQYAKRNSENDIRLLNTIKNTLNTLVDEMRCKGVKETQKILSTLFGNLPPPLPTAVEIAADRQAVLTAALAEAPIRTAANLARDIAVTA